MQNAECRMQNAECRAGIIAAVCNRGICPSVRFFRGKTRPTAAWWMRHLGGGYSGYKPLLRYPPTAWQSG
jgi:hypothetical protein